MIENELTVEEHPRPESWKVRVHSVSGNGSWIVQHTADIDKAIALASSCFEFGATRVEIEILPDQLTSDPLQTGVVSKPDTEIESST